MKQSGYVYFVGAGPGNAQLLTIEALNVIKQAEAIVYDQLVDENLLASLVGEQVERYFVGKGDGEHIWEQCEINELLTRLAKQGKTVVRLKGGDPLIFGRLGEEIECLQASNVTYEIVAGITAATAAAARLGIPLTHRDFASSVSFITGHLEPSKAEVKGFWKNWAKQSGTLVLYMATKQIDGIVREMIEAGKKPTTPVAVIANVSLPNEAHFFATLQQLPEEIKKHQIKAPAVMIIGEVVRLGEKHKLFSVRPLHGKSVLVTRPKHQQHSIYEPLQQAGANVIDVPLINIQPVKDFKVVDATIKSISNYDWLVFTSVNGVTNFMERVKFFQKDARILSHTKIAVIGPGTKYQLEKYSLLADVMPSNFIAEELVRELTTKNNMQGKRVLLIRGTLGRPVLKEELENKGAKVTQMSVYDNTPNIQAPEALQRVVGEGIDYVTLTSSSTASSFFQAVKQAHLEDWVKKTKIVSIGPVTTKTIEDMGYRANIEAAQYTIPGLVDAIIKDAQ